MGPRCARPSDSIGGVMSSTATIDLVSACWDALRRVDDPEYPGVSIVDLGLVERVELVNGVMEVDLIPTFSGCPALAMIAADVEQAISESVDRVGSSSPQTAHRIRVRWCRTPVWTTDRLSEYAKQELADQFTVAVQIGRKQPSCPRCDGELVEQSLFGPSRCRSIATCTTCGETVETMRS